MSCVAFSPDGRSILTGSADSHARLWNGQLAQPTGLLCDFGGNMGAGIIGLDGKTLVTAADSGIICTWDLRSGRLINEISQRSFGSLINMVLSPDGTRILTCDSSLTARVWETATGQPIGPTFESYNDWGRMALSPDGKVLAVPARDKSVQLRDAMTGQPLGAPLQHPEFVMSMAFSPDGTMLLTGGVDKIARCWEVATGRLRYKPLSYTGSIYVLEVSPAGKTVLLSDGTSTTALWDITSGRPLIAPLEPSVPVASAAFSPDGKLVLTGLVRGRSSGMWRSAGPSDHQSLRSRSNRPSSRNCSSLRTDSFWSATVGWRRGSGLPRRRFLKTWVVYRPGSRL